MAEAVFRQLVSDAGLADEIEVDSAGTGGWHIGSPPHRGTQAVLRAHHIPVDGLRGRQMGADDLRHFDYLVVMDDDNARDVAYMARRVGMKGTIVRLLDFADPALVNGVRDVPDPYYVGGFDYVYSLVHAGAEGLLAHLTSEQAR